MWHTARAHEETIAGALRVARSAGERPRHRGTVPGEVELLVAVLRRDGALTARQLQRRAPYRRAGLTRFRAALRAAIFDGRVRRVGGGRYEAAGAVTSASTTGCTARSVERRGR
jgi:hypothetical protein